MRVKTERRFVLIDVENVTWAILKQKWILEGLDSKDKLGLEAYVRTNRNHISFTKLLKYIICDRQRETWNIFVDTYAVSTEYVNSILAPIKQKVAPRNVKKAIDNSFLIRLFSEEVTLLQFFNTTR